MNRQQLEKRLATTPPPQGVLLYGEGEFWIEYYSKKISSYITDYENISTFYFGDYDYNQVLALLGQSSLFGDQALVILKIDKKISKKELQAFLIALSKNPSNFLIVEFYKNDSKSSGEYARDFREMVGVFKGEGIVEVRFFEPNLSESQMLLNQRAKELDLKIDMRNLMFLLGIQNGNVGIALKELEKFIYFDHPITEREIAELCSGLGSMDFDDLLDALLSRKDLQRVMEIYVRLEEEGLDEMGLLGAMGNHFYKLFLFFAYIRSKSRAEAKEILGYAPPSFIVEKLAKEAMSLRERQYQQIFEILIEWRLGIFNKKGKASGAIVALQKIHLILQ